MHVLGVKFKVDGKSYNFMADEDFSIGDKLIVETERGLQLGEVASNEVDVVPKDIKEIVRRATDEDYDNYLKNVKDSKKVLEDTKKLIKESGINMNLIDATFSLDRKILLFNFTSEERVDFRELVKKLAVKYHARIELHQIGIRDKAKVVGGLGLCGRILCCHGCLKNVNPVNINMVKNQNIALNPTKINGACGRLLCCFTYENDLYEENRKLLPKIGEKIKYNGKVGTVVELDILNKKYKLKIDENTIEEVVIS